MEGHEVSRRSRRIWIWSALGVVVIAGTVGGLLLARNAGGSGNRKKGKEGPSASPVEITAVSRGNIATWLQTTTSLEAQNSAVLIARGQGEVVQLLTEEGTLKRGAIEQRTGLRGGSLTRAPNLAVERFGVEGTEPGGSYRALVENLRGSPDLRAEIRPEFPTTYIYGQLVRNW